jgi:hypothetical protein
LAGVNPAVCASKPLAVQQVSAGEFGAHPRSAQMIDRRAEQVVGGIAFTQERS